MVKLWYHNSARFQMQVRQMWNVWRRGGPGREQIVQNPCRIPLHLRNRRREGLLQAANMVLVCHLKLETDVPETIHPSSQNSSLNGNRLGLGSCKPTWRFCTGKASVLLTLQVSLGISALTSNVSRIQRIIMCFTKLLSLSQDAPACQPCSGFRVLSCIGSLCSGSSITVSKGQLRGLSDTGLEIVETTCLGTVVLVGSTTIAELKVDGEASRKLYVAHLPVALWQTYFNIGLWYPTFRKYDIILLKIWYKWPVLSSVYDLIGLWYRTLPSMMSISVNDIKAQTTHFLVWYHQFFQWIYTLLHWQRWGGHHSLGLLVSDALPVSDSQRLPSTLAIAHNSVASVEVGPSWMSSLSVKSKNILKSGKFRNFVPKFRSQMG